MTGTFTAGATLTAAALNTALNSLTLNAQTGTTYTFVLTDAGKLVTASNASAQTYTIPLNSSVAYSTGTVIEVQNISTGTVTLSPTGGVTLNGSTTVAAGARVRLTKTGTDTWYSQNLGGGGLALITAATFSAVASTSINSCFTSTYANYLVALDLSNTSADATVTMKMRVGGVSASTAYYGNVFGYGPTSALSNFAMNNATAFTIGTSDATNSDTFGLLINIMGPAFARQTRISLTGTFSLTTSDTIGATGGGMHNTATAYDGIELLISAGTMTGTARVYGLANS